MATLLPIVLSKQHLFLFALLAVEEESKWSSQSRDESTFACSIHVLYTPSANHAHLRESLQQMFPNASVQSISKATHPIEHRYEARLWTHEFDMYAFLQSGSESSSSSGLRDAMDAPISGASPFLVCRLPSLVALTFLDTHIEFIRSTLLKKVAAPIPSSHPTIQTAIQQPPPLSVLVRDTSSSPHQSPPSSIERTSILQSPVSLDSSSSSRPTPMNTDDLWDNGPDDSSTKYKRARSTSPFEPHHSVGSSSSSSSNLSTPSVRELRVSFQSLFSQISSLRSPFRGASTSDRHFQRLLQTRSSKSNPVSRPVHAEQDMASSSETNHK